MNTVTRKNPDIPEVKPDSSIVKIDIEAATVEEVVGFYTWIMRDTDNPLETRVKAADSLVKMYISIPNLSALFVEPVTIIDDLQSDKPRVWRLSDK